MKVQVQSKHNLDEKFLVSIWHRSSTDECFVDWRRHPQTNLGVLYSDSIFFWMNWIPTNKGLIPVFDLDSISESEKWRISVHLDDTEKSVVIVEDEASVYVYRIDTGKLTRFLLLPGYGPRLLEIQVDEIPEWLEKKISAIREEISPSATLSRLNGLAARLEQLKQRRS